MKARPSVGIYRNIAFTCLCSRDKLWLLLWSPWLLDIRKAQSISVTLDLSYSQTNDRSSELNIENRDLW